MLEDFNCAPARGQTLAPQPDTLHHLLIRPILAGRDLETEALRARTGDDYGDSAQDDFEVQPDAPVVDIGNVEGDVA